MSRTQEVDVANVEVVGMPLPGTGLVHPVGARIYIPNPVAAVKAGRVRFLAKGSAAEEAAKEQRRAELTLAPLEAELAETTAALPVAAKRRADAEAAKRANDAAVEQRDRITLEARGSRNQHEALQVRLDELRIEVSSLRARLARAGVAA